MQVNIKHGYWTYQGSVSNVGEVTDVKVFNGTKPYTPSEEELIATEELLFSVSQGARFSGMTVDFT